ncbi:MAG: chorismate synthase [Methanotrichaceae archaeon]|nr:chorismate synthase [Methanotrichaceae archaeon]
MWILGGISTGAPIVCKIAAKSASIARRQRTLDLTQAEGGGDRDQRQA